jgi:mannose-1-phosphate guanylyltransferase
LILRTLESCATRIMPFPIQTDKPFQMRRGICISMSRGGAESRRLYKELREAWLDGVSEQDRGGWWPHWTVMNKVNEEERVQAAFEEVEA